MLYQDAGYWQCRPCFHREVIFCSVISEFSVERITVYLWNTITAESFRFFILYDVNEKKRKLQYKGLFKDIMRIKSCIKDFGLSSSSRNKNTFFK